MPSTTSPNICVQEKGRTAVAVANEQANADAGAEKQGCSAPHQQKSVSRRRGRRKGGPTAIANAAARHISGGVELIQQGAVSVQGRGRKQQIMQGLGCQQDEIVEAMAQAAYSAKAYISLLTVTR
jgi:hypothetical protein